MPENPLKVLRNAFAAAWIAMGAPQPTPLTPTLAQAQTQTDPAPAISMFSYRLPGTGENGPRYRKPSDSRPYTIPATEDVLRNYFHEHPPHTISPGDAFELSNILHDFKQLTQIPTEDWLKRAGLSTQEIGILNYNAVKHMVISNHQAILGGASVQDFDTAMSLADMYDKDIDEINYFIKSNANDPDLNLRPLTREDLVAIRRNMAAVLAYESINLFQVLSLDSDPTQDDEELHQKLDMAQTIVSYLTIERNNNVHQHPSTYYNAEIANYYMEALEDVGFIGGNAHALVEFIFDAYHLRHSEPRIEIPQSLRRTKPGNMQRPSVPQP